MTKNTANTKDTATRKAIAKAQLDSFLERVHSQDDVAKQPKAYNSKSTFNTIIEQYEECVLNGDNHTQHYIDTLNTLATIIAQSVTKKCIDVSHNDTLVAIKKSITVDQRNLFKLALANEVNVCDLMAYDSNGELVATKESNAYNSLMQTLTAHCFGDGVDLVHDAMVAILTETAKADKAPCFMTTPYTIRRLKKKVWIKEADSVNGWETVETTPIQEIYKHVRRAIDSSRAVSTDPRNGYTYLSMLAHDSDSDTETTIYKRLDKYSDLGGVGVADLYSASTQTVRDTETMIASLNLSARQTQILALRMRGYGYKAIATYLGVDVSTIKTTMRRIQKKVVESAMFNTETVTRYMTK